MTAFSPSPPEIVATIGIAAVVAFLAALVVPVARLLWTGAFRVQDMLSASIGGGLGLSRIPLLLATLGGGGALLIEPELGLASPAASPLLLEILGGTGALFLTGKFLQPRAGGWLVQLGRLLGTSR